MCIRRSCKNNVDVIINGKKYSLIFDNETKKIKMSEKIIFITELVFDPSSVKVDFKIISKITREYIELGILSPKIFRIASKEEMQNEKGSFDKSSIRKIVTHSIFTN
jgi:hypothetical protein